MERFTWGRGRPILTVDGIIPDLNWGSGEGGAQMSDGLPFPASRVEQAAPTTLRKCQHKHFLPQVALCEVKGTDIKKTKQKKKTLPSWYQVAFSYSPFLHQLDLHFPVNPAASYQSDFCSFVTVLRQVSLSGCHSVLMGSCFDVSALFPSCFWPPLPCTERI